MILQLLPVYVVVPEMIVVWINGVTVSLLILYIPVHDSLDNIMHFQLYSYYKVVKHISKLEQNKFYLKYINRNP